MHINRKYGTYEFRNIVYWTYFRKCNSILQNPWKLMPENTNIESNDYDFKIYYIWSWFEHFYCYFFTKLWTSSYDVIFIVLHLLRRILFTLNTDFLSSKIVTLFRPCIPSSGMVTAVDEVIGNITNDLKTAGIFNDTVIIFTADKISQKVYFLIF